MPQSMPTTENDACDREAFASREELQRDAHEMALLLEREHTEAAVIDEDRRRYAEWTLDFQAGHGNHGGQAA